ncbi:sulfatase family protein [Calycomorphotria hydatis]|uniref:Arylsulfatase n=1 Tax=Calycomorphotria hydatis TaxID=2528027 RepID=A0A517T381_9PLAN|nr:sulfatase-like hydrolase/transferase [Calycomorphotria hydatis]QDT62835.1 Arylsulfatase [Calycomorphotria hydatis]
MRILLTALALLLANAAFAERPNIVLMMADDQGWGQMGYYDHPVLKTPNLDAMAANGLRFDRFYAGNPVCSPTRATVLTGRTNERTGVRDHGYAMRRQEKTLPSALREAGYATGHFGKWHLNGLKGPGAPIFADDTHHPGQFGFDTWVSVSNYFDRDPIMSRQGEFEDFEGDSSEIIVAEALKFISQQVENDKPFFSVIWCGSPHAPWRAGKEDTAEFASLDKNSREHYGELVAIDRSVGTLRQGLRDLNIAENTLVWYCSDNGGLNKVQPDTVGGLRGYKGQIYEGGLRVPAVIEWPAKITEPRITEYPAGTVDIFPTLAAIVGLPESAILKPCDGTSLYPLFTEEQGEREKPLGFRYYDNTTLIDNDWKILHVRQRRKSKDPLNYELYNLASDPHEEHNLVDEHPGIFRRMKRKLIEWNKSVDRSVAGKDYPEGEVRADYPQPETWSDLPQYKAFEADWKSRPAYADWYERQKK